MAVTHGCYCSQVRDGEAIITEGKKGDEFYIVESGLYSVTQQRNGVPQEIHTYHARQEGSHPSFGELALMYDKPRAATVTAKSDGVLWVIDRRSFRSILMKSEQLQVDRLRVLRRASALKPLSLSQLDQVRDLMHEGSFTEGQQILPAGSAFDGLFIIFEVRVTARRDVTIGLWA